MLSRLFIAALWSPAGKGLTSWLLFVMFNCVFVTFPCDILGQVWYSIISIPDLAIFLPLLMAERMTVYSLNRVCMNDRKKVNSISKHFRELTQNNVHINI